LGIPPAKVIRSRPTWAASFVIFRIAEGCIRSARWEKGAVIFLSPRRPSTIINSKDEGLHQIFSKNLKLET
jgi:hypothetical protein